jgi:thiopeptide-type bacteriocin biosynthesis protein
MKNNLEIVPSLIVRTPIFPVTYLESLDETKLNNLLQENYIKIAIKHSSINLFNEYYIKNNNSTKIKIKLFKYVQRMCYRPTPFGLLAGSGLVDMYLVKNSMPIFRREKFIINQNKNGIKINDKNQILALNPTLTIVKNEIRFYFKNDENENLEYTFKRYKNNYYFKDLLIFFKLNTEVNKIELIKNQRKLFKCIKTTTEYINYCIQIGLIIIKKEKSILTKINNQILSKNIDNNIFKNDFNIIFNYSNFSLSSKTYYNLNNGIKYLFDNFNEFNESNYINEFISKFSLKYGNKKINLLKVFDPINGINFENYTYKEFDHVKDELKTIIKNINISKSSKYNLVFNNKYNYKNEFLPSSFNVLFKIINEDNIEKIYLKYIIGNSALTLLNRFNKYSNNIDSLSKKIIAHDIKALENNVVYADINYSIEKEKNNILDRNINHNYYIDCFEHANINTKNSIKISLSELKIFIYKKEIILYSQKLKKRIIPINSSSYVENKRDLPIFIFLNNLIKQNTKSSIGFSWGNLLKFYNYFPRIECNNIILSPETWILDREYIVNDFKLTMEKLKIPKCFVYVYEDLEQPVNTNIEISYNAFLDSIKNQKTIKIIEDYSLKSIVINEKNIFNNEFIGVVFNNNFKTYKIPNIRNSINEKIMPLDDWLYIKIYVNQLNMNHSILILNNFISKITISKWFYVRYSSNGETHIRLRILPENQEQSFELYHNLKKKIMPLIQNNTISKIEICTYERDVHKFPKINYEIIETIFYIDTQLIINILKKKNNSFDYWMYSILIIDSYMKIYNIHIKNRILLLKNIKKNIIEEFSDIQINNKDLNTFYKKHEKTLINIINNSADFFNHFIHEMIKIENIKHINMFELIHLSLNRLFDNDQNKNELFSYCIAIKYYESIIHINN